MIQKIITSIIFGILFFLPISIRHGHSLVQANSSGYLHHRDLVEPLVDSPGRTVGSDFNGDGIHDLFVGADQNNDGPGANNAGALYILYGAGTLSETYQLNGAGVNVTILGKAATDRLGSRAASGGDINSDGFDDLLIGAYRNDDGGTDAGAVYILLGSPNLAADIRMDGAGADSTVIGKSPTDTDTLLGYGVGGGGDINGDGFDDAVMGAFFNDDEATDAGAVYILYGAASLTNTYDLDGTGVSVTIVGKATVDRFGTAVSSIGDFNRDGFDDILAGAWLNDDGAVDAGAIYVLYGGTSLSTNIRLNGVGVNLTIIGKATSDLVGFMSTGTGDINGDGFDDLLTGSSNNADVTTSAGAGYIFYGRLLGTQTLDLADSTENVKITPRAEADDISNGSALAMGDVNDDGLHDILISADKYDKTGDAGPSLNDEGAAFIIYGSSSLATSIPIGNSAVTILGKGLQDYLGTSISGVGDVNNDGIPDILVSARGNNDTATDAGAAYIVYGSESLSASFNMAGSGGNVTILGKASDDRFGFHLGGGRSNPGP